MRQVRHGSATTTHAVQAAIQRSQASHSQRSQEFGINSKTVSTWRKRATVEDMKTGPTEPRRQILIADEPTGAHDGSVQTQVPLLIDDPVRDNSMGRVLISHDLKFVARYCDRIMVMNAREAVEICDGAEPAAGAGSQPMGRQMIQLQNVHIAYGCNVVVHGVSFTVAEDKSLPLVGESGSGKSTALKTISGLAPEWTGDIAADHEPRLHAPGIGLAKACKMVIQDPCGLLHPRKTAYAVFSQPLAINSIAGRDARAEELLPALGLNRRFRLRFPHQLSGGQRQRVAIARAMLQDKPTSALDVSAQAAIFNLLDTLRRSHSLTHLLVKHGLPVEGLPCDRMAVMHKGRVVEIAPASALRDGAFTDPCNRALYAEGVTTQDRPRCEMLQQKDRP